MSLFHTKKPTEEDTKRRILKNSLDMKQCTFLALKSSVFQEAYECRTCSQDDVNRICFSCAKSCHCGHIIKFRNIQSFVCYCGSNTLKDKTICKCNTERPYIQDFLPLPTEIILEIISLLDGASIACLNQVNRSCFRLINKDDAMWKAAYNRDFHDHGGTTRSQIEFLKKMRKKKSSFVTGDGKTWKTLYMQRFTVRKCNNCRGTFYWDQGAADCKRIPRTQLDMQLSSVCITCGKKHDRGFKCGIHRGDPLFASIV